MAYKSHSAENKIRKVRLWTFSVLVWMCDSMHRSLFSVLELYHIRFIFHGAIPMELLKSTPNLILWHDVIPE